MRPTGQIELTRAEAEANARALVARVRSRLARAAGGRALLIGAAGGVLATLAVIMTTNRVGVGVTVGGAVAGMVAWFVWSRVGVITPIRAALWLEEQVPALQFALVTLVDAGVPGTRALSGEARERLVARIGAPNVSAPLSRSTRKQLLVPGVVATLLLAAAFPLAARAPRRAAMMRVSPVHDSTAVGALPAPANALANWRVRVTPPSYSGLPTVALGDVGLVNTLVGSTVEIVGGDATSPGVHIKPVNDSSASAPVGVTRATDSWHVRITMPAAASEVRFVLPPTARQLLLEPRPDSLPVVRLQRPQRDSVYRAAKGAVTLEADAHDDLGLASACFELIVTSGEGERFTAKTLVLAPQKLSGDHERHWQTTMLLDTMKLEPGDIVHMRAVARDRHPDAAREMGTSETRTFRMARPGEYDSVAVEPAPPPEVQQSLMSQRMLLILTEKLEARRPKLARAALVSESRKLAAEQVRLRKTVGDLVFQRLDGESSAEHSHFPGDGHDHGVNVEQGKLVPTQAAAGAATGGPPLTDTEGDESPVVGINKPLLEAYNAMWDAASALDIADPKASIPHMKLALAAIERARTAERIYLRGKPPVVIIDVAKVRLAGKDTGQTNARSSREALSPKDAAREARLLAAALLLTHDVPAARDSLALLRLESLTEAPRVAAAIGDALEIVRRGGDVTSSLVRARRLIGGTTPHDSLSAWRGVP
jgi:hypothetical protein